MVAEALLNESGQDQTIYCPAFPRAGRTVFQGHLFVGDILLCESGMQNHPLNPMTDANLVRLLAPQVAGRVGSLTHESIRQGPAEIDRRLEELKRAGVAHVIVDTCDDRDLQLIASAVAGHGLVTGGSGLARFLPAAYRETGALSTEIAEPKLPAIGGRSAILAGSCSAATLQQVRWMRDRCRHVAIDVPQLISDIGGQVDRLVTWTLEQRDEEPVLFYSTADPDHVSRLQRDFRR